VRVGVISDTHGLLRPAALAALRGCDHVLHAGDVGDQAVLTALAALAPLTAVRGNNDHGWRLPEHVDLTLAGHAIHLVHDVAQARPGGAHVVVAGHSHQPRNELVRGVLWFNPGSAGRAASSSRSRSGSCTWASRCVARS